ncbi:MAG: hypothetical protein LLF94_05520 [Chlamydiales bacterium]|nr:hypothetical protein [Chlamydiales bacterium]
MNELGYSFDSISKNNVVFPDNQSDRLAYAGAVRESVTNLAQYSLIQINQFRSSIEDQVGRYQLLDGKNELKRPSTRFFLWIKEHHNWSIPLHILSLGITFFISCWGQRKYTQQSPLIELANSIEKIDKAVTKRLQTINSLENSILNELAYNGGKSFEVVHTGLHDILKNRGSFDYYFLMHAKSHTTKNAKNDLANPDTYIDERRYTQLTGIYKLLECKNELAELFADKEIYLQANHWDALDDETKSENLARMKEAPARFKPILLERIAAMKQGLTWEVFSKSSSVDRQKLIAHSILLSEGLPLASELEDSMNALSDYVQKNDLKKCDWQDAGAVSWLQTLCTDLGISKEFQLACETVKIEQDWANVSFEDRLKNTNQIVTHANYYEPELERRRKEVFGLVEQGLHSQPIEVINYVVENLSILKAAYSQGCTKMLKTARAEFLKHLKDSWQEADEEVREELIKKAKIIGIEPRVLSTIQDNGIASAIWKFITTGKRYDERIQEEAQGSLVLGQYEQRSEGTKTDIDHVPTSDEFEFIKINKEHLDTLPPSVPEFKGKADVRHLMTHIWAADKLQLIPNPLREIGDKGQVVEHQKNNLLNSLNNFLCKLETQDLNDRLTRVLRILKHYTAQVEAKLKACQNNQEKREVYIEIVELIAKEMGFACYHCEDRKYNAAMAIFNEKIIDLSQQGQSTAKNVHLWLAKKRNELVTQMLQEMIQESMNRTFGIVQLDVASAVGRWRYALRGQLGLGDVPAPQYSQFDGNLSQSQIMSRFYNTYTPDWILEQALEEYNKEKGESIMKWPKINEFFAERINNIDALDEQITDEDFKLRDGAMILYLQEAGVFEPVV